MKKVLFIGNRPNIYKVIEEFPQLKVGKALVPDSGSFFKEYSSDFKIKYFDLSDQNKVVSEIRGTDFDILISNGCPIRIPISKAAKQDQLFINIHPSYLPYLRGPHPVNGALFENRQYTGVTMHYMDDDFDTGNIIYQEKVKITRDLDIDLLYRLIFELEAEVFKKGMTKLIRSNFKYIGKKHPNGGSFYIRNKDDQVIDFSKMNTANILTAVRAFGSENRGVEAVFNGIRYKIFSAEKMENPFLFKRFSQSPAGEIIMTYSRFLLVKVKDGIIKLTYFKKING